MQSNVTNLAKWVSYWQQMEKADLAKVQSSQWNDGQDSLDRVASSMFDLNGDRESPNESNSNANFQRDQQEHDARLPGLHRYNTWEN